MTDDAVIAAANACLTRVLESMRRGVDPLPERMDTSLYVAQAGAGAGAKHLMYCCGQIVLFIQEGRREKAMRWLGFVQGALWTLSVATIDELGKMNMPNEPTNE